jgi:hypothetical protein
VSSSFASLSALIRVAGITHTEITQLAFIRSLARFFLDTAAPSQSQKGATADEFYAPNTIDELYQLAHPDWTSDRVALHSYPLKSVVDLIQVRNALVDLNPATKNLPSAHFDSESFVAANRRIMELRRKGREPQFVDSECSLCQLLRR